MGMDVRFSYARNARADLRRNKKLPISREFLELMTGFEPVTYALPRRCATTCATSATLVIIAHSGVLVKLFFKKIKFFFESRNLHEKIHETLA